MDGRTTPLLETVETETSYQPVELTFDDKSEKLACDDLFPDELMKLLEQEEQEEQPVKILSKEVDYYKELIEKDDIFGEHVAPNRVITKSEVPDKWMIEMSKAAAPKYCVHVEKKTKV